MLIALHKMNPSSKEIESSSTRHDSIKIPKSTTFPSSSSTTPWLGLKDPRIVRVFGGKDRHSKVCTIKGLRDRRVRLSIPTAMQLYDLQERLGLNQPSKVVDWLLNAAKDGIDELPPLPIPPEHFALTHQPVHDPHEIFGSSKGINIAREKEKSEGLLQDPQLTLMPSYGSFYPLETSNISSFSQSAAGGDHLHIQNLDALPLPSTLLLSSGGGGGGRGFQTLVTQPYLSNSGENDSRQLINHQVMNPSIAYHPQGVYYSLGQSMRPIHFSVSPRINLQYSWRGNDVGGQEHHQPNKGQEFHFK